MNTNAACTCNKAWYMVGTPPPCPVHNPPRCTCDRCPTCGRPNGGYHYPWTGPPKITWTASTTNRISA